MTPAMWGKAGVRLTEKEIRARASKRAAEANKARLGRERDMERAAAEWSLGHVRPWRITTALDLRGFHGPWVDEACGAFEPDVDQWEEGILYPTWEQVVKLAKLCDVMPGFFVKDGEPVTGPTTMEFHSKWRGHAGPPKEPVLEFTHQALVNAGIRKGIPEEATTLF